MSNTEIIEVGRDSLPLSCPVRGSEIWDKHPRVYLPLEKEKKSTCPYCGTKYVLIDENK